MIGTLSSKRLHLGSQTGFLAEVNMGKKETKMCKWKEADISEQFEKFSDIVKKPKFVCKKCGRVADNKKRLHKPIRL